MKHYDLIVIGSGPAGEKGAAQASLFGKRVAIVERSSRILGIAIVRDAARDTIARFAGEPLL